MRGHRIRINRISPSRLNPRTILVPIFDDSLQARRSDSTTRLPIPLHTRNRALPSFELVKHLARLPIPKTHQSRTIATRHEAPIRTHAHVDRITARVMATETLLAVLAEAVRGCVDDDLVVAGLETYALAGGVRRGGGEGVHVWFSDEFDGHGDVDFPRTEGLVVAGGDEAAVLVAEGDGVYGTEMVVVFLGHFAGVGVELDDLLVAHAREEFLRVGGIEFDDVWDCTCFEAADAFAGFGVPSTGG